MDKYNCYIVNRLAFKVDCDIVDYQHALRVEIPLTAEDIAKGKKQKSVWYLVGRKTTLNPEGKKYLADDCFKTRELAEDKLVEVMRSEIEKNEILMKNLSTENCKLYEKIQNIHDRRHKETNE